MTAPGSSGTTTTTAPITAGKDGPGKSESAPGHDPNGPGNSENAPGHNKGTKKKGNSADAKANNKPTEDTDKSQTGAAKK
jgi:hypothetical protein